jgi:hypothetical protein
MLVQALGHFSLTVKDAKDIFTALHCPDGRRGLYWPSLFAVVQNLIDRRPSNLLSFFNFNGVNSGLMIPTLRHGAWPASGYTLIFWMRVESGKDPANDRKDYKPRVFSALSDDGFGIEVFFEQSRLVAEVNNPGKNSRWIFKFNFQPKAWYFVALSHVYNMIFKSELTLFVNGQATETGAVTYPKMEDHLTKNHIGTNGENPIPSRGSSRPQPFSGQMGFFMLLDKALLPPEITKITNQLGPNMEPLLNPDTTIRTGQRGSNLYLDSAPVPIVFAYNPRATDRALCHETARGKLTASATRMEGVQVMHCTPVAQAFQSAGGVELVVPLFIYEQDREYDPFAAIELLQKSLLQNVANQNTFIEIDGFPLVGWLLQQQVKHSRHSWTEATVSAIVALCKSLYVNEELFKQAFKFLLFDFRIWSNCEFKLQLFVLQQIYNLFKENTPQMRTIIGVKGLVDIFRQFFTLESNSEAAGRVRAMTVNDFSILRASLFNSIGMCAGIEGFQPDEQLYIGLFLRENAPREREEFEHKFASMPRCDDSTNFAAVVEARRAGEVELNTITNMCARHWRKLQFRLGLLQENPESTVMALDSTENKSRMRRKLKKNFEGSRHRGCVKRIGEKQSEKQRKVPLKEITGIKVKASHDEIVLEADGEVAEVEPEAQPQEAIVRQKDFLFRTPCEMITPLYSTTGVFEITASNIFFIAEEMRVQAGANDVVARGKDRVWALDQLTQIHRTRYMMKYTALELFFDSNKAYYFNFASVDAVLDVYRQLQHLHPKSLQPPLCWNVEPRKVFARMRHVTEKWRDRKITNFDYLMHLNTLACRSFNDITQYPVFPHVIADYTSEKLDLERAETYRDLAKPIGALEPERLAKSLERYHSMEGLGEPRFIHGSHYSNVGFVLYYLIRLEPFCSHFITMQGGKFDYADRMFHSVPRMWDGVMHGPADFKELIPEFFYLPEFLSNLNEVEFGEHKNGPFDPIELPPWAQGSVELFIEKQRDVLESEYVSRNLHRWIDLIFGYKQTGEEAVKANNLFHYLSYEGVELDAVDDPQQKLAFESQLLNFGMTPAQLLQKPHPPRKTLDELKRGNIASQFFKSVTNLVRRTNTQGPGLEVSVVTPPGAQPSQLPVCFVAATDAQIALIYKDGVYSLNNITFTETKVCAFARFRGFT